MAATTAANELASARMPTLRLEPAQVILVGLLALEIAVFGVIGTNFFSLANAFEVLRLSVEIGLLAVALTPVITTGGIDLSVGSLMGLSAVVFGKLWRDGGLSIGVAAAGDALPRCAGGELERALDHARAYPRLDRDTRLVLDVSRAGRGIDRRRGQLHPFPRAVPLLGPGLFVGVPPRCRSLSSSRRHSGSCSTGPRSAADWSRSAFRPKERVTPGCRSNGSSGWFTCSRDWSPAWRRSSTWRTWARPRPTPAPATSWRRSLRSYSEGHRSSAAAVACPVLCSGSSPSPFCKTACAWPTSPPSSPGS